MGLFAGRYRNRCRGESLVVGRGGANILRTSLFTFHLLLGFLGLHYKVQQL
jgi:hypothetical protein